MILSPYNSDIKKTGCATERMLSISTEKPENPLSLKSISTELIIRVNRINPRVLNLWKKIVAPQREPALISFCFLLLYCEVDSCMSITPNTRIQLDKTISIMKEYLTNPGYVVTVVRKTKEYIDKEMISVETIKRIYELIKKTTAEQIKSVDKSFAGLALYELIVWAVYYYRAYAKEHYGFEIFEDFTEFPQVESQKLSMDVSNTSIISSNEPQVSDKTSQILTKIPNSAKAKANSEFMTSKNISSTARNTKYTVSEITNDLCKSPESGPRLKPHIKKSSTPSAHTVLKPCQTETHLKQPSLIKISPIRAGWKGAIEVQMNSPKPIDRNILAAKKIINSEEIRNDIPSPIRSRRPTEGSINIEIQKSTTRDVLEIMQYIQIVEEKFRHFLIEKLKKETEKFAKTGMEKNDIKVMNEIKGLKNKMVWIEEFEKVTGMTKYNSMKKLGEDGKYKAELCRAQRQLDILDRYNNQL
ncbi:hypothetical protein SteCoe_23052 [Stentor coeruleus]|uniref:Uncharacterized protein n=1 Tax=Stentor coeruleus TaxID=5963 RepID=A0A1R2BLD8_9CILI|nr:hypothetical protein SteCoe_23052 [Stentor coeruleus]